MEEWVWVAPSPFSVLLLLSSRIWEDGEGRKGRMWRRDSVWVPSWSGWWREHMSEAAVGDGVGTKTRQIWRVGGWRWSVRQSSRDDSVSVGNRFLTILAKNQDSMDEKIFGWTWIECYIL